MNHEKIKLITSASVIAAALSFGPGAYGQTQSSTGSSNPGSSRQAAHGSNSSASSLRVASSQETNHTADRYDGAQVRGSDGQNLGQIRDFLVNPQSGRVCFAVVSSGGWAGIGDTLRLVPFDALQPANGGGNVFTVSLAQSQWHNTPSINEDKFEEGRVTLQPQQLQQLTQTFASSQIARRANSNTLLLRASKVRGLDVTAQGQDIGSVEGVVVQPGQTQGFALLDPDDDFAGSDRKFLVPLSRLTMSGNGSARTSLSRDDFRSASPSSQSGATVSADNPNASSQRLSQNAAMDASSGTAALLPANSRSPTGFTSTQQVPTTNQQLLNGVQSIRRALDANATTSHENVTIVPENGKITLRGSVSTDALKSQIENTAREAGQPNVVVSRLTVQNQ
jgi:hypothetical protein